MADPQLLQRFENVQRQLQNGERQMAALEANVMEIQTALGTIAAMEQGQTDGEVLLPLGGGIHVRATITADAPVLRAIGSDTAVDGTLAEAKASLEARKTEVGEAFSATAAQMQKLSAEASRLQGALQALPDDQANS